MDWLEPDHLRAAAVCLAACGVLGWFLPVLIARIPERPPPEILPDPPPPGTKHESQHVAVTADALEAPKTDRKLFERSLPAAPDKVLYAEIAAAPHLAAWTALWSGLVGGCFGAALGWTGALLFLVPLVPIGVALMIIDWRTTLLPTRVIHPTYVLLAVLIPLAALVDRDLDSLYRAGWGWLLVGGWFWVFWWLFNAWGFGDVRLARVLGPALGYLGWYELVSGLVLIVLVGGLGGLMIGVVTRDLRRRVPYGPFMLVGSGLAVVIGPWMARSLGY